jgi:tetratricopeptide (TPR) repeat protein
MATERDERSAPVPAETVADTLHRDACVPPSRSGDTVAEETGVFTPGDDAHEGSGGPSRPIAEPLMDHPAHAQAPRPVVPPSARPAARNKSNGAATEAIDGTAEFVPGAEPAAQSSGPEPTLDMGRAAGPTVSFAATAAFETGSADAASTPGASGRPVLPATDPMATGDYGVPAPSSRPRNLDPGARCGRYVLKRFHAKGGMGEIWMAEDPDIGRPVALKRMRAERPEQVHRFRVEAQVTGQLEHPGVVPVHELGVSDAGQNFYAMKFVQGRTLKSEVEEYHNQKAAGRASDVEQVRLLQIFLSLCQTVAYAHSRGVLHRDLKPENVMLGEFGETILLDWGIAKVIGQPEQDPDAGRTTFIQPEQGAEGTETRAGAIMGTPSYMAPEVAAGKNDEVDFRSDVYLLGATLYEMLTARPPRSASSLRELVKKAREETPERVRTIDPLIPKALDAICFKAMAQAQRDRYQSARELADDVQRYLAGEPVAAYPEGFWGRAWRWAKRHRATLVRAAAAAVLITASAAGYAKFRQMQHERAELTQQVARAGAREQARSDLREFLRLADEASFYAATTDQVMENAHYSDPRKGEETTKAALALASKWGPQLEGLPLENERPKAARELAELTRLADHLKTLPDTPSQPTRQTRSAGNDRSRHGFQATGARGVFRRVSYESTSPPDGAAQGNDPSHQARPAMTALDHYFRGESYREQGRRRERVESLKESWKPDKDSFEQAISEYRKALAIDPEHYWSHFQIGRCELALRRFPEAVEALGACIALKPETPWAYAVRGLALFQSKRLDEAQDDLDRAVRLNPDFRPSRLNRGLVYWLRHRHEDAIADFSAVLAGPEAERLVEGAYYRGMVYAALGDNKNAMDDFDLVVAKKPYLRAALLFRAQVRFAEGQADLGLEDIDRYIANEGTLDRRGWQIHGARGHILRSIHSELPSEKRRDKWGRTLAELAIEELMQAVSLGGQAWDIFDDLGAMLEHTGRPRDAIPAYSKGLEFAPSNVKLLNKRGWAFEAFGRHKEALADFTTAAKADPANGEAHTGAGYVLAMLKDVSQAQRAADLAMALGADEFLVLHNVACIYATLADSLGTSGPAYQEVAIAILKRSIAKWKETETPLNEIDLIKAEPAFKSLQRLPEFRKLIAADSATKAG